MELYYWVVLLTFMGVLNYADENIGKLTNQGYQVLTCRSSVQINNWQPYQNDDAPNKNGIAAGEFDCNNTAFVGKVNVGKYWSPGRIQTIKPTGIYAQTNGSKEVLYTNGICDPYPKYQCGQVWKQFNSTSLKIDGFKVGSTNFIGRSCGHKLGRAVDAVLKIQTIIILGLPSTNGHKVPNALEQHSEGHFPFYIGTVRVNSQDFIGKVLPGQGLIILMQMEN
ncbi:hypothetical protein PVAND_015319 [Polypedilum vanderplanki]|uniref:Uncharacterized protein n=1 Tax=Polypedilum vanderplanki TaxID=319348 RepID=A0A9J6BCN8_POLVA|nr:hypothetical protein PVAND_015319 [Polypedilum vanderplanki]